MWKQSPEIMEAYDEYVLCRGQQLLIFSQTKGKGTVQRVLPYTVGISVLPRSGGTQDQPHRLMVFFDEFLEGERESFYKRYNTK